jgi:hypothetical protein
MVTKKQKLHIYHVQNSNPELGPQGPRNNGAYKKRGKVAAASKYYSAVHTSAILCGHLHLTAIELKLQGTFKSTAETDGEV